MDYHLCLIQKDGARHYLGPRITVNAPSPVTPGDLPPDLTVSACGELLARVVGWEYFKGFIAPHSIGVEIGVDHGDGADRLLERNPSKLYLVDPWLSWDGDPWYSNEQSEMDARHQAVVDRFADDSRVSIQRHKSHDFLISLPDVSVDWVFIDGDHTTDGVYDDLVQSFRVVRPGGYIAGDDMYGCKLWEKQVKAGYKKFLDEYGAKVEVVWDQYDPFILRKKVA